MHGIDGNRISRLQLKMGDFPSLLAELQKRIAAALKSAVEGNPINHGFDRAELVAAFTKLKINLTQPNPLDYLPSVARALFVNAILGMSSLALLLGRRLVYARELDFARELRENVPALHGVVPFQWCWAWSEKAHGSLAFRCTIRLIAMVRAATVSGSTSKCPPHQ